MDTTTSTNDSASTSPISFVDLTPAIAGGRIPEGDSGVKAIVDLANKAADIKFVEVSTEGLGDGLPATVILAVDHRSGKIAGLRDEIERYRIGPDRRKGTLKVTTLQSFIDATNVHKDTHSAIFAKTSWPQPSLTAVIDYNEPKAEGARWGQHRVQYDFPITEELKAWIDRNGKAFSQAEFAAFLEEHAAELAAPFDGEKSEYETLFKERFATPNELLDLSRSLEVFVGAKAKQSVRLQSGERVVEFIEEHSNGKGEKVEFPGIFVTSMRAFLDGEPVRIIARLRYRISGGDIAWFYQLYRWDAALRERVQNDLLKAGKDTALPTYEGAPES